MFPRVRPARTCVSISKTPSAIISGAKLNELAEELSTRQSRGALISQSATGYASVGGSQFYSYLRRQGIGRFDPNAMYIVTKSGAELLQNAAGSSLPQAVSARSSRRCETGSQSTIPFIRRRSQVTPSGGLAHLAGCVRSSALSGFLSLAEGQAI